MDFSSLNNPADTKPIGLGTVLLAVGIAALDASPASGPLPFPGSSFITVPIAGLAVVKYFQQQGLDIKDAPTRRNPLVTSAVLGAGALATTAVVGVAALYAYKVYSAAEEREPALQAVEESPVLSLLNPAIGAATGAALGYASGQPVWKGTLYGFFFALALKRLAIEVIYSQSKVK